MNIRLARVTDYETLKKIKPSISDRIIEERLSRQEEGKVEFMILEDNNEPVSFVLLKWEGKKTHPEYPDMEDLYTKGEFRRKGYATLLIKECEKRVKEKGLKKIGMAVNPDKNSKVKVFYEKLGYRHDGGKLYVDAVYNGVEDWVIDLEKEI
ncbi:MAG: GCN5-related N-acetyltransferase [Candidatus Woesebacteria bacterium GW2011_GWB1_39_12]|uniref:GCN5-related N-acetyltransferase n=2 Tax=Candidatus Woeseibacteriota TaxID=1752722 RepID=A0A0G0M1Y8_9BACT|nr:MAG: GCN5-related N-acetyltransferase [Candidatus Woesebacteria bacterium GW2011_GWA1_39_12]KKR00277.1 MAG: GCN5-related N-acetyltransferase [Candidatus Woesebacteria bacterium GW2011_GWB1_39_12]